MTRRLDVGEAVRDARIVGDAAGAHIIDRQPCETPREQGRQQERRGTLLRYVQGALQVDERRRTFGIPAVLILAHPLDADRLTNRSREQSRVSRGVLVSVS